MLDIIFLKPVFKEMIWGGNRLKTDYGYDIPSNNTGECWAVSAHSNGDCTVINGDFKGFSLSDLWTKHRELFGNVEGKVFPLLIKIIDAKADLSIQVHPDDTYAKENENGSLGKTECWYILECEEGATIVIGHNAKDRSELVEMIGLKKWKELIQEIPIKKGDFFQIEPGTVHAIKAGTVILETQQNSDITYRLYDYDRLQDGKPRELHLEKSIDVIKCPQKLNKTDKKLVTFEHGSYENLVSCDYYSVRKIFVKGQVPMMQTEPFTVMSVIDGEGLINDTQIRKGDHFILPSGFGSYTLDGDMELISSYI